jgi:hypothetical protein
MRKTVLAIVIVAILAAGAAFADHPDGWGIGIVGNWNVGLFNGYGGGPGFGVSLKAPQLPIFWGIGMGFGINPDYFGLNVTGDYYLIDKPLVPAANLHWFWGVGGFFDFYSFAHKYNHLGNDIKYTYTYIDFGGRMPVGLSWQPIPLIEVFTSAALTLGLDIYSGYDAKYNGTSVDKKDGSMRLALGLPISLGLRFWL